MLVYLNSGCCMNTQYQLPAADDNPILGEIGGQEEEYFMYTEP